MYNTPKISRNRRKVVQQVLPSIPDKRYFTIGEVGVLCDVKPHVLRYWEEEFKQLNPVKRRGNRRYYQFQDVILVRQIRKLLYDKGYTIEGARAQLSVNPIKASPPVETVYVVKNLIADLESIVQQLKMEDVSCVS